MIVAVVIEIWAIDPFSLYVLFPNSDHVMFSKDLPFV